MNSRLEVRKRSFLLGGGVIAWIASSRHSFSSHSIVAVELVRFWLSLTGKDKVKILVTGGSGYLGSVLVPILRERHDPCVLDVNAPLHPRAEWIKEDIRNNCLATLVSGFDAIVHLAAIVGDAACNKDPHLAVETNYLATKALAKSCAENRKRMIFASTCSVYGSSNSLHKEDSDPAPFGLYAMTKLLAEKDVLSSGGVVLRLGTLHGNSPKLRLDLVVNEFVRNAIGGRIVVYGGEQVRPFLHISDAANIFVAALAVEPGIYNVAAENTTILELAERIRALIPCELDVYREIKDRRSYAADCSKIRQKLGLEFKRKVEDTAEELSWPLRTSSTRSICDEVAKGFRWLNRSPNHPTVVSCVCSM